MRTIHRFTVVLFSALVLGSTVAHAQSDDGRYRAATVRGRVSNANEPIAMVVQRFDTGGASSRAFGGYLIGEDLCVTGRDCDNPKTIAARPVPDAEGNYRASLPGAYLPGYETDTDWMVTAMGNPAKNEAFGPVSSFEFEVNNNVQEAPDLPLWRTRPTVEHDNGLVDIDARGAPARAETDGVRLTTSTGSSLWTFSNGRGAVDFRLLEDQEVIVLATAGRDRPVKHSEGDTIYHQYFAAAGAVIQGTTVPLSRGARAEIDGDLSGSYLVDGDFANEQRLNTARGATLDLGTPQTLGVVVLRNNNASETDGFVDKIRDDAVAVQVSSDGKDWASLDVSRLHRHGGYAATPNDPVVARFIRVEAKHEVQLAEISAFAPLADGTTGLLSGSFPSPVSRRALVVGLIALAGVLVVMARRYPPRTIGVAMNAATAAVGVLCAAGAALATINFVVDYREEGVLAYAGLFFTFIAGVFGWAFALAARAALRQLQQPSMDDEALRNLSALNLVAAAAAAVLLRSAWASVPEGAPSARMAVAVLTLTVLLQANAGIALTIARDYATGGRMKPDAV